MTSPFARSDQTRSLGVAVNVSARGWPAYVRNPCATSVERLASGGSGSNDGHGFEAAAVLSHLARHHHVDTLRHRPRRPTRRRQRRRAEEGVGVERGEALVRHQGLQGGEIRCRMHPQQQRVVGERCVDPHQIGEPLRLERRIDGPQPVDALRVAGGVHVREAIGMADQRRRHPPTLRSGSVAFKRNRG